MSDNPSPKQSSNGSAADLIRVVEQLIDSDQQEKNLKKIAALKGEFPVLRKMNRFMTNQDKMQVFLRDPHFKTKAQEKLIEKGVYMPDGVPILKVYLVSTRYGATATEQFDENDLLALFQRFGILTNFYASAQLAFVTYQQIISSYVATKTLNEFPVCDLARLCVAWCTQDEGVEAQLLFLQKKVGGTSISNCGNASIPSNTLGTKHIMKFLFQIEILPQFNIAQRIIGPGGNYLKSIIEKVIKQQSSDLRYQFPNIDSLIKIRLRGKGSGYQETLRQESEEKMHLFVSSRYSKLQQQACEELQKLLYKVLQEYKIQYQKIYRRHAMGIAYKVFHCQGTFCNEVRQVLLEDIETPVDFLSLESQGKLPEYVIQEKIRERNALRKNGRYQEADQIRDWLKSKGVKLVDSKVKGRKCAWSYERL